MEAQVAHSGRAFLAFSEIPELASRDPLYFMRQHVATSTPAVFSLPEMAAIPVWQRGDADGEISVAATPNGRADSVEEGFFALPETRTMLKTDFLRRLDERDASETTTKERQVLYYQPQDGSLSTGDGGVFADFVRRMRIGVEGPAVAVKALGRAADVPYTLSPHRVFLIFFLTFSPFFPSSQLCQLWIGDEDSVTSTHSDSFENVYSVVTGRKVFRLWPPTDAGAFAWRRCRPAVWVTTEEGWRLQPQDGGRRVPWVVDEPAEAGLEPYIVELGPGDALFLPAHWHHEVSQVGVTVAVNWWWSEPLASRDAWYMDAKQRAIARDDRERV